MNGIKNDDSDAQEVVTAYHESGHVVAGYILNRLPLFADIVPDHKQNVGHTEFEEDAPACVKKYYDQSQEKKDYLEKRVLIELAGTVACDLKYPERTHDSGDFHDRKLALDILSDLEKWYDNTENYINSLELKIREMLRRNWPKVEAIANELLSRKKLSRVDILNII